MKAKINISKKKINVGHTVNSAFRHSTTTFAFSTISLVNLVQCGISESFVAGCWYWRSFLRGFILTTQKDCEKGHKIFIKYNKGATWSLESTKSKRCSRSPSLLHLTEVTPWTNLLRLVCFVLSEDLSFSDLGIACAWGSIWSSLHFARYISPWEAQCLESILVMK